MRVRVIELRILGAALTGLWIAAFVLVLLGYRPGGPVDILVGLAAGIPIFIALGGILWPPVARGGRAFAAIAWLGLGAVLVLVPSIQGVLTQLAGRGPQTLVPSLEAGYPWILALVATSLYTGLGIARRRLGETALRRRRLLLGAAIAVALVAVAGSAFTVAAVVNELALADRPASASRFGPTDPALEPPPCSERLDAGPTAVVELTMDASIDDRRSGQASIDGTRDGADVRWLGFVAGRLTIGQYGAIRVGDRAWTRGPGGAWTEVDEPAAAGIDLDRQLVAVALEPGNRVAAEDRGLSFIEGARARHCRIALDGATLRSALPEIELLVGQADVSRLRGDLDYWVFGDGQLGQADGRVNGSAVGLAEDALQATIRFRMTALDRGQPVTVKAPLP